MQGAAGASRAYGIYSLANAQRQLDFTHCCHFSLRSIYRRARKALPGDTRVSRTYVCFFRGMLAAWLRPEAAMNEILLFLMRLILRTCAPFLTTFAEIKVSRRFSTIFSPPRHEAMSFDDKCDFPKYSNFSRLCFTFTFRALLLTLPTSLVIWRYHYRRRRRAATIVTASISRRRFRPPAEVTSGTTAYRRK